MVINALVALQQGKHPKLVIDDMSAFLTQEEREKVLKELKLGDD